MTFAKLQMSLLKPQSFQANSNVILIAKNAYWNTFPCASVIRH